MHQIVSGIAGGIRNDFLNSLHAIWVSAEYTKKRTHNNRLDGRSMVDRFYILFYY